MYAKNKNRPAGENAAATILMPLMLHTVRNQAAPTIGGGFAPRRLVARQLASATANHARAYTTCQSQS
jgi:ABC-type lipopolysaccharide export system ATPase subunit